ncbi:MAG: phosphoribosylformylglycinamidine synthase subunit PurQ [Gemmatimonadetes bacterium]|nr:phosphoribosylformylglycinamidine synthase subunit PurQ [Gemmatimonadota bacterium]
MRVAVVRFPGSNCDEDTLRAARAAGADSYEVWHRDTDLRDADAVMIPGGFAYGDHLRAGAIARFSPVMTAVAEAARAGMPVLGICNGFQVLCEAGLLPGALMRNAGQLFLSRPVAVRIENTVTPFTNAYQKGAIFRVPIAHGEGRYVASPDTVAELESEGRVVMRYATENPNGSVNSIAGIVNTAGNVVAMMPHPERAAHPTVGESEGAKVFESVLMSVGLSRGGST